MQSLFKPLNAKSPTSATKSEPTVLERSHDEYTHWFSCVTVAREPREQWQRKQNISSGVQKQCTMTLNFQKTLEVISIISSTHKLTSTQIRPGLDLDFNLMKIKKLIFKLHYVPVVFWEVYFHIYVILHKIAAFEKVITKQINKTPTLTQVWKKENVTPMSLRSQTETKELNFSSL